MLLRLALALPVLIAPGLLVAASAPVAPLVESLTAQVQQAANEAAAAEANVQRLERAAVAARDEAERLRARQSAAAEAIAASEAHISAADGRLRMIEAEVAARREQLARQQQPAGALLAGLALMASRPPIIAMLDQGSTEELVRVRLLLDTTLPALRRKAALLSREVAEAERLQRSSAQARAALLAERSRLAERRRAFAVLEEQALQLAEQRGGQALGAGDLVLAREEEVQRLSDRQRRTRAATSIAAQLAAMPPAPARPFAATGSAPDRALAYRLPADAPVAEGFGAVSAAGVRSRGILLATSRGVPVRAPASGIIRFSGPFRDRDGVVIIDHGRGWLSLILNLSSPLEPGTRVQIGQPLGRALGPLGVELSREGRHLSPALIAGSSGNLSNSAKGG